MRAARYRLPGVLAFRRIIRRAARSRTRSSQATRCVRAPGTARLATRTVAEYRAARGCQQACLDKRLRYLAGSRCRGPRRLAWRLENVRIYLSGSSVTQLHWACRTQASHIAYDSAGDEALGHGTTREFFHGTDRPRSRGQG